MKIINAKDLRNWSRFACEMQRLKKIFPEHAEDIKNCVLQVAGKIEPTIENEKAVEEILQQAESLRLCAICGFPLDKSQEKFCSVICAAIFKRKNYLKQKYPKLNVGGEKIYLHRIVWEKNNGRRLKDGEVVHHINCNPEDNRPENLQAMTASEHSALHEAIKRKERYDRNGNLFENLD